MEHESVCYARRTHEQSCPGQLVKTMPVARQVNRGESSKTPMGNSLAATRLGKPPSGNSRLSTLKNPIDKGMML